MQPFWGRKVPWRRAPKSAQVPVNGRLAAAWLQAADLLQACRAAPLLHIYTSHLKCAPCKVQRLIFRGFRGRDSGKYIEIAAQRRF